MKLHNETVSPQLTRCLKKIMQSDIFKDFNLVGGTCLSLQLGHRRSIDIDLFTAIDYGSMNTTAMKVFLQENFPYSENLDSLDQSALGYSVRIGESPADCIKADFFYTENFIFPVKQTDDIRLADIREIAAMKIKAITQEEPRQKDFWDIYELNNTYSLKEMIEWAMMRDEWSFTKNDIKAGFERIFDVKECPEGIDCYRGYALTKEVVSKRWHNLGYRIVTLPDVFGHPDEFRFRCATMQIIWREKLPKYTIVQ